MFIAATTGCRTVGDVLLPPHPASGWDKDAEFSFEVVGQSRAIALALEAGVKTDQVAFLETFDRDSIEARVSNRLQQVHVRNKAGLLDSAVAFALKPLLKGVGAAIGVEAKRYDTKASATGTLRFANPVPCADVVVFSDTPDGPCAIKGMRAIDDAIDDFVLPDTVESDEDLRNVRDRFAESVQTAVDANSFLYLAIQRRAPGNYYWFEDETPKLDLLYLVQIIPDDEINAMKLVPSLLQVNRTAAKVVSIDHRRFWSLINPVVILYELVDLLPWWDGHSVKGSQSVKIEAPHNDLALFMQPLGAVTFDLKSWPIRELPYSWSRKDAGKSIQKLPYFAWTTKAPLGLNVQVEGKEENGFGGALTFLSGLISDEADTIADEAKKVLGLDDDATDAADAASADGES